MTMAVQELESRALTWPEQAKALTVSDQPTYDRASEMRRAIRALRDEINAAFDPIIAKAHAAHKEAVAQKKRAEAPLVEADLALKLTSDTYLEAEERARRKREAELAEIARKAAEDAQVAEAAAYERAGEHETAQAIIEAPPVAPAITLPKPKAEKVTVREEWDWRVSDAEKVPRAYMQLDTVKIGGVVRALKGATNIPGIVVTRRLSSGIRR